MPGDEIHPPVHIVEAELKQIRREMVSAAWDDHRDYIYELERNLKRDTNYQQVTRLTSVAVFTAKMKVIAERIISESREKDSQVGD
jgi:hypothetical protein